MAKSAPKVAPPKKASVEIELAPSPEAPEGLSLERQARALTVTDKGTHYEALEFVRGAKQLKRKIEDHWSRITRSVDDLKRNLLTMKRADLEPVEKAIEIVTAAATTYQDAEERRAREQEERNRRAAEEKAQREREQLLAKAEADALAAEENSPTLSTRENVFVGHVLGGSTATNAAKMAGYKDAEVQGRRLLATQKITDAIQAKRTAAAIREQAAATKQQPLDVVQPRKVEMQTAKVAGVRSTMNYRCEVLSAAELIAAVIAGTVEPEALIPNEVYLNQQARQLKEAFQYPGCRLVKTPGLAG